MRSVSDVKTLRPAGARTRRRFRRLDDKAKRRAYRPTGFAYMRGTALGRLQALEEEKSGAATGANWTRLPHAGSSAREPLEILLVEDNPADVRMTREALAASGVPHQLHVVRDGIDALAYLCPVRPVRRCPKPDVVLLGPEHSHVSAVTRCLGEDQAPRRFEAHPDRRAHVLTAEQDMLVSACRPTVT